MYAPGKCIKFAQHIMSMTILVILPYFTTAAAAVCDVRVTRVPRSPRVAPTQGRRAAGQLNQINMWLWGALAASARECLGHATFVADWIHRRVHHVLRGKSTAVAATKLGQEDLVTS